MADDTPDLVSNINITGTDTTAQQLSDLGDKGAAAFDKIGAAAEQAGQKVSSASDQVAQGGDKIDQAFKSAPDNSEKVKAVGDAAYLMGGKIRDTAGSLVNFGTSLAGIGAAAGAAIIGFAKFADSITKATRGPLDLTAEFTRQQEQLNRQEARNTGQAEAHQVALDKLNREVQRGIVNYKDYNVKLRDINEAFADQQRAHHALQEAQRQTLKENQELQIQAGRKEAYNALVRVWGTDMTGSLIALGNQAHSITYQLRDAFGPVLSSLVDKLVTLIDKNSGTITNFIDTTSKAMANFIKNNGPAIDKFATQFTQFGKAVFDVFKNIIIPAFEGLMTFLNTIAGAINSLFGTNINGAFLLVAAVLLKVTGGFKLLGDLVGTVTSVFKVLTALFGPWGIVIGLVVIALIALYYAVDWEALGKKIADVASALKDGFFAALEFIKKPFTDFPKNLEIVWQAVKDGAQKLWDGIKQAVVDMWEAIKTTWNDAIEKLKGYVTSLYDATIGKLQGVIDKAKAAWEWVKLAFSGGDGGDAGASQPIVSAATGGHIQGPGTWTSDSILARLSNNEYVVQAKRVAQYGVGFMNALNQGKLDIGALKGFAIGGLVNLGTPAPVFSGGGIGGQQYRQGRVLNLTIDGNTFGGLTMPEHVAERLTKFAVQRQTASAGRKPGWIGGNN